MNSDTNVISLNELLAEIFQICKESVARVKKAAASGRAARTEIGKGKNMTPKKSWHYIESIRKLKRFRPDLFYLIRKVVI